MLNVTDQCVISPATGEGAFLPSWTLYICFYDMKARHKASLLTATRKLENIFPSLPSRFAPLSSPGWRVCPHLCWDKSSCVSGLSELDMPK